MINVVLIFFYLQENKLQIELNRSLSISALVIACMALLLSIYNFTFYSKPLVGGDNEIILQNINKRESMMFGGGCFDQFAEKNMGIANMD